MSSSYDSTRRNSDQSPPPSRLVLIFVVVVLGILALRSTRDNQQPGNQPQPGLPAKSASEPHGKHAQHPAQDDEEPPRQSPEPGSAEATTYKVEHQTIRDLNGHIVFEGTVDLTPTIQRIARGESNRHSHDGTIFQNREGRLPRKSSDYYKEYVHPTPGQRSPGPQRVIVGSEGDIWYTPDHYKTFVQIR